MYAIVKTGGKQIKVAAGDKVTVERLDVEAGKKVELDTVLMIADGDKITVGAPLVAGATVTATVVEQMRDKKVIIFKKRRRQNSRRKNGHRQSLTVLKIDAINFGAAKKAAPKAEAKPAAEKKAPAKTGA